MSFYKHINLCLATLYDQNNLKWRNIYINWPYYFFVNNNKNYNNNNTNNNIINCYKIYVLMLNPN